MKLYAFYPNRHGPLSFFVVAETEDDAYAAVNARIEYAVRATSLDTLSSVRCSELAEDERNLLSSISASRHEWPHNYTVEAFEPGQIAVNDNA